MFKFNMRSNENHRRKQYTLRVYNSTTGRETIFGTFSTMREAVSCLDSARTKKVGEGLYKGTDNNMYIIDEKEV